MWREGTNNDVGPPPGFSKDTVVPIPTPSVVPRPKDSLGSK